MRLKIYFVLLEINDFEYLYIKLKYDINFKNLYSVV